jgi:hypothetical protein
MEDRPHPSAAIKDVTQHQAKALMARLSLDGGTVGAMIIRRWLEEKASALEGEGVIVKRILECAFHPATYALLDTEHEETHGVLRKELPTTIEQVPEDGSQVTNQLGERWGNPMWPTSCDGI